MQQTRIIRLLSTLNSAEIRRFEEFVESPYFNTSVTVRKLLAYLIPFFPDFNGPGVSQSMVLRKGLKLEEEHVQKLHDASSALTRLLEEFLAVEQLRSSADLQSRQLCEQLTRPGREWYFPKKWKSVIEVAQSPSDLLSLYQLQELGLRQAQTDKRRKGRSLHDERLKTTMAALDQFYLVQKLQLSCETLNRQKIVNSEDEIDLLDEISSFLNAGEADLANAPLVRLYHGVLKLLVEENDEAFETFMTALGEVETTLGKETGIAMYSYAQNYCIRQINKGRGVFLERLFELYVSLLDNGFILESDLTLAHWNYKNITTVALRLRKYEWVDWFLETYRKKLQEEIRESVYSYNMAAARYEQKDYTAALKYLQQTNFTDVHYDLSARSMLLKIYFEINDDEALGYSFQAFEVFLRRNKAISKEHLLIHKNLIRYLKKIQRLRERIPMLQEEETESRISALTQELEGVEAVANKGWLMGEMKSLCIN